MDAHCRIELFGGLRLIRGDRVITRFNTRKTGALLGYLAYHLTRKHAREALAWLLWPESHAAAGNLRVSLNSLRHQLEPPGIPAGAVLMADRLAVGLNPAGVRTDVADFEAALQTAAQAGSSGGREQHLTMALEIYSGELLAGYHEEWIEPERQRLSELFFQSSGRLIRHLEEAHDLEQALDYARRGVRLDPLREEAHLDLMRLYAASGQPLQALRHYREFEQALQRELETAPGPAIQELARDLVRLAAGNGQTTWDISGPAPAPPATTDTSMPRGTVTFLLIVPESPGLPREQAGKTFPTVLNRYHALLRQEYRRYRGHAAEALSGVDTAAFSHARDALLCALAIRQAVSAQKFRGTGRSPLQVRMALDTGAVEVKAGKYHGPLLEHAARLLQAGHGGQILCSEEAAVLLRRVLEPGIRLKDLGLYRLGDVAMPERVFQVDPPDAGQEFPPLKAEAGHVSHLPLTLTRFFGREEEIARLQEMLLSDAARLVTLTGPPGSGKTRLALEAAKRLVEPMRGAVWFAPLAARPEARLIGDALAGAMDIPRTPRMDPFEQAVESLSRQPSLLILDNFEHLVAEGAATVSTLLARVPALTCLVTSRQRLDLAGEREFLLLPLKTPEGPESPERLAEYPSVQLFADRAQAVKPDFQVTAGNAAAVGAICARLEGIPLALELAAARVRLYPPGQMLSQLEDRFGFLVSRRRDAETRHQTLRAAVEWSYRLLSPEVRRFFAKLSVFRGGWTVKAAEAVCEEPQALEFLTRLVECSLVLAEDTKQGMRYRMLEMLREYGKEQLSPVEWETLERRHADYFLALAEESENAGYAGEWFHRLETEHDNYRRALDWSKRQGQSMIEARLAAALFSFWDSHGYWTEGRNWLEDVLTRRTDLPDLRCARLIHSSGILANQLGDYESATAQYEESRGLYRQLQERSGEASALRSLGWVATLHQADYRQARLRFEESLAICKALEDYEGIGDALRGFEFVADVQGDTELTHWVEEERRQFHLLLGEESDSPPLSDDEKLAKASQSHNKLEQANIYAELGRNANRRGDYELARSLYEKLLILRRELGDKRAIATVTNLLGCIALDLGDYPLARSLFEEALPLHRELGDKRLISMPLLNLGNVAFFQGNYPSARVFWEESLAICREIGYQRGEAVAVGNLGELECDLGNYDKASFLFKECLGILSHAKDQRDIIPGLEKVAKLALARKQYLRAVKLFGSAASLRESRTSPLPPSKQPERSRQITLLRETLGEAAFTSAWEAGRALTWEQAVAEALEEASG